MSNTRRWLSDLTHFLFPHTCVGCGSDLLEASQTICHQCYIQLPETNFSAFANNPIEKIFYGRVAVQEAMAAYYFTKGSTLRRLIHTLKYKNNQEVGLQLGRWMGLMIQQSNRFKSIDALVPLPLFPEKEKKRGYNQAAVLCSGIAEILNTRVINDFVQRKRFTDTQTKKGRHDRWLNVEGSFELNPVYAHQPQHVLLVDDVVTTGATLDACGSAIAENKNKQLSIAALAWASDD